MISLSDVMLNNSIVDSHPSIDHFNMNIHILPLNVREKIMDEIYNDYSYLSLSREGKNGIYYNHQVFFSRIFPKLGRMIILDEAGSGKTKLVLSYLYSSFTWTVSSNVDIYNYINLGSPNINMAIYAANNKSLLRKVESEMLDTFLFSNVGGGVDAKLISSRLSMLTYHGLVNRMKKYDTNDKLINSKFGENMLLIVDEIHNITPNDTKTMENIIQNTESNIIRFDKDNYSKIQAIYRLARYTSAKIIFLSASIMANDANPELASILSMLFGEYVSVEPTNISRYNLRDDFYYLTYGYSLFIRASRVETNVEYKYNMEIGINNDIVNILNFTDQSGYTHYYNHGHPDIKIMAYGMSTLQSYFLRMYNIKSEDSAKNDSFYNINNKITFAIPVNEEQDLTYDQLYSKYGDIRKQIEKYYAQQSSPFDINMINKMDKLKRISTVYYNFILNLSNLFEHYSQYSEAMSKSHIEFSRYYGIGSHAVYIEDIESYGLNLVVTILEHNNHTIKGRPFKFDHYSISSDNPKYAIITSATKSKEREQILNILHSASNHSGKLIKLVIFTDAVQGLNIRALSIQFLSIPWNKAKLYQSMYRIIRAEGLSSLLDVINKYAYENNIQPIDNLLVEIILYTAYPQVYLTTDNNRIYFNESNNPMSYFDSYGISKYIKIVEKNIDIDKTLFRLRQNSFSYLINDYRRISENDFCIYNCIRNISNPNYDQFINPIRSYQNLVEYSNNIYYVSYLYQDVLNDVYIPKFANNNSIRDYYVHKYKHSISLQEKEILEIYTFFYVRLSEEISLSSLLEKSLNKYYNVITQKLYENILDIENCDNVLQYQYNMTTFKYGILDLITDQEDRRIIRNMINFWFIMRMPDDSEVENIEYHTSYFYEQLTMDLITTNTNKILMFHSIDAYNNLSNEYTKGRLFIGYDKTPFKYKTGALTKWKESNASTNMGIYMLNMYRLLRYADMGIYSNGGNIFVIDYYKTDTDKGKDKLSKYRYYYYPNVDKNKKTSYRGNTSKTIEMLCMNMVLVGMDPYTDHLKGSVYHINTIKIPNLLDDIASLNVYYRLNNELEVADSIYSILISSKLINDSLKSSIINIYQYIPNKFEFITRLYSYYKLLKSSTRLLSTFTTMLEKFIENRDKNDLFIYREMYHF